MTKIEDFVAGRTSAELYETYLTPGFFAPWAEEMAELAAPGQNCLDLACGTGAVSRGLAAKHNNMNIKAVDVAPLMLDEARKQTRSDAVEYHLGSADALPFDNDTFDMAFCQQGLQFFPDKEKAFDEVQRVLKPGGRFAVTIWRPVEEASPVFESFAKAVGRHLGEDLLPLGPFSFGSEERLRRLTEDAGFKIETLEQRTLPSVLPPVEALVLFDVLFLGRPAEDGSLQPVLAPDDPAGDAVVDKIINDMEEDLKSYIGADGNLHGPASTHFMIARK
jgi:ubiquinone/menaquinone biosynthesis C-methylase UbiE